MLFAPTPYLSFERLQYPTKRYGLQSTETIIIMVVVLGLVLAGVYFA
jgi:hypothetical protein